MAARITNIVASVTLDCTLCYETLLLSRSVYEMEYTPARFSGVLIRLAVPLKSHCRVYHNGKMTINGAKTVEGAHLLAELYCTIIRACGYITARVSDFKVVNIVASVNFGQRLNLYTLQKALEQHCIYEPERFPGLSIKLSEATCVIFQSGKCNILRAKGELDIQATVLELNILAGLC